MSKRSKLSKTKKETSEDMAKYNAKSKKSSLKHNSVLPVVQSQAMALDSGVLPVVQSQAMALDSGVLPVVQSQAMALDSGVLPVVLSQAMALDSGVLPVVQSQAMALDSGVLPVVESQAEELLDSAGFSVMSQAHDLDSDNPIGYGARSKKKMPPPPPQPPPPQPPPPKSQQMSAPVPPPVPPVSNQLKTTASIPPTPKITASALELERKKLKKPDEIKKQVNLERSDFFDIHQTYTHIPLLEARESLRMSTLKTEVISISFDGIEQMSDGFLFSLFHCKLNLSTVKWISLTGCYNVTDEGVYWISQTFTNIKSIQLSGCNKITEKSINYLKKLSMQEIILDGTNCGVLPLDVNLGQNFQAKPHAPSVTFNGCPMMSPMLSEVNKESGYKSWSPGNFPATLRKLVILTPENLPWNPLAILTNGQDITAKSGLLYKHNWTPFKDNKIKDVKSSAEIFNVFQITRGKGLTELIMSPGSIVILPYYLHKDMPKAPAAELAYTIISILSKYDDCSFVLWGMSDSKDTIDYEQTVKKMLENVNKYFNKWIDRLDGSIRTAIHTNWRMAAFNYLEQDSLSQGEKMLRHMRSLLNLTTSSFKVGEKLTSSDLRFLSEIVELDETKFPWNRQAMMSGKMLEYSEELKKSSIKLTTVSDVQNKCKFKGLPERTYTNNVAKLLSYSTLWGHCVYYPELETAPVVTDFQFLADIIQKLMFTSAPQTCDIRCLGDKIPCWKKQDLKTVWPGASDDEIMLLLRVLEKQGILLTFAVDPWCSIQDVSYIFVLYKDLPSEASMLEDYWPLTKPDKFVERTKFYFCCPGLPESFFPNLLRHVFKLGGPSVAWESGAVIIKGHLTILIERIYDVQGLPVIVIQVRGPGIQDMRHSEDWTTLKLYCNVMDHLAVKYKLSVAKTMPCLHCENSTVGGRYEILASKKPGRYFHEHLVRGGENRDVKCKHCHHPCSVPLQLGPGIELNDLVPWHDRGGSAGDTSNFLSRCLMCENCAIDGIQCEVNLKHGIKNWRCGCDREGMLCNYCGMCQRCFIYIKMSVSVVEPMFTPLASGRYSHDQLVANDEVSVTEKGSVVGLLTAESELIVKSCILTPNYCPDITLTVIKNAHFKLSLLMDRKDEQGLQYFSDSGRVMEVLEEKIEKELLGKDTFRTCKDGDTMKVSLRYLKGTYKMMKLSLHLNGTVIYSKEMKAIQVKVKLNALSNDGVFLQITTPGKFIKKQTEVKKNEKKNCGEAVKGLTCALEMKMYNMLESMESVCFNGRGLSLSGSACVTLPSKLTLQNLKYPKQSLFNEVIYHHLCLTWNPVAGRATLSVRNQGEAMIADRRKYSTWNMKRLVHFSDGKGIHDSDVNSKEDLVPVLWMWHFIMTTYPEMILPGTTQNLFPDNFLTDKNQIQVKEGLRALVMAGFWKHFSEFDIGSLEDMFQKNSKGILMFTGGNPIVKSSLELQEILQENIDKTGLKHVYSKFNKNINLYLCPGHANCMCMKDNLVEVLPELYGHYSEFLSFIDLGYNNLTVIPENFFNSLPNLLDFKIAHNFISEIPASVKNCKKLLSLVAMENNIADLPDSLSELTALQILELGNNCFPKVPSVVTKLTSLTKLTFPYMMLTEMPDDIGNLVNLKYLHVHGNCFTKLPSSFTKLVNLEEFLCNGVQWAKLSSSQDHVSYQEFNYFLQRKIDRWLEANGKDKRELFHMFDENSNGVLDIKEIGKLNAAIFNLFPRLGYKGKEQPDESTPDGFPREILSCTKLKVLILANQGITRIPPEICQLTNLYELNLTHNPNLLSVPAEISQIKSLKKLDLDDCPLLKTPPREIRDKGFHSTFAYLQRLLSGAVLSKRTKLMLVGLGGAGKTSLVKALLSEDGVAKLKQGEDITDGIDIQTWQVKHEEEKITYNIWDFAGQTVYYNTHQFFLSANRAIYLLLWNVRLGHEHAGLDFWLSSISVQAPKAPVFVIGTHIDQVSKSELPLEEMQQRYPQVVGFHFISSYTGQGVSSLKSSIFDVTLQQQYMGEHIPAVWLTFENNIEVIKKKNDIVTYNEIELLANKSGIFEPSEIFQAVQFLHDLGSVQHFTNEYLKSNVVINPQWIVDVMACVVSVKNDFIKNGRLVHDDIDKVWSAYPKKLRSWLLRLTEEFDLTFQLKDQPVNLVPCLLPEKKPEFTWPEIERGSDIRENKMVYTFEYLPAGLFNRAQVRLHSLSDSALIWKKGSYLIKNVHVALLQHVRDCEMVVTAQGPRPENILFLIHEVFEGLIAESFHGVTYDFTMPCPECQAMAVKDPHMFAASTIRRALDMQAPFLQCIKYFHTISCSALQTLLPPDSHSDFDAQLVQCVQGLKHLRKDLAADIFISYCGKDNLLNKSSFIVPSRVHSDLVNKGYKCWCKTEANSQSTDDMAKSLIDSSVFIAFISMNYADDIDCVNIFKYARLILKKTIVVVAIGDGFEWKQSKLGILLSDEVFVNMTKGKFQYYDSKFDELIKTLKDKSNVSTESDADPKPQVFFSYTWVNSAQAVTLGTREVPGALGYGDPRELKSFIEEHGVRCWIDVERVGMNGLFDDIAEGLLSAKVVVVCVSDEYASSSTCQIEFRYAANTLRLPIIMAVVGTGDNWRATEVGLTSVYYPIVNFQEKTKNAKQKLLKLVTEKLSDKDDATTTKAQKNISNEEHKNLSYQELFELGQRRLLRQLTMYAENQDLDVYPRVFVVDFVKDEDFDGQNVDEDKEGEEEKKDIDQEKMMLTRERTLHKELLSKKTSVLLPAYRLQKYCVHTLCEHDEGWHSVSEPLELEADFGVTSLDLYSPYISRLTTVTKYNKKLVLNCLTDEVGEAYIDWLEKSPEATMSDYQNVYHSFREMVHRLDTDSKMGNLSRCHLSNGKTIWLCDKHRDSMKVTCLSNDDKSVNLTKDADNKVTNWMLTGLRTMEQQLFDFKSVGNAPRPKSEMKKGAGDKRSSKKYKKGNKPDMKTVDKPVDDENQEKTNKPSVNIPSVDTSGNEKQKEKKIKEVPGASGQMSESNKASRQLSDDNTSVTSEASQLSVQSSTTGHHKSRRQNLPGQSKYKPPSYKQTSRACEIS
ncbi:uncharacterized protein LOC132724909 isoform X2 [Ruditapes philippinarum]|uniref:uncharacterized protein LOC132724909 isoform X2 n=1 Tax=Ruditapes philippinarum TaxID=129788 RepID=UPI00295BB50B|nr:uncharacterized protein LOC132724909 isoform X2 [Ruditapes philippinarum]